MLSQFPQRIRHKRVCEQSLQYRTDQTEILMKFSIVCQLTYLLLLNIMNLDSGLALQIVRRDISYGRLL